jgi:hypothetical protein
MELKHFTHEGELNTIQAAKSEPNQITASQRKTSAFKLLPASEHTASFASVNVCYSRKTTVQNACLDGYKIGQCGLIEGNE